MSRKDERRKERQAEWDAEDQVRRQEEARKAALSMYERIQEMDGQNDIREILHMLAEKLGLE